MPPSASSAFLHHGGDLVGLRHVGAVVERLDAVLRLDVGAGLLDLRRIAEAVDDDIGVFGGERPRDGETDAAGRSGNEGAAL